MALSGVFCISVFMLSFVVFFIVSVSDDDPSYPRGGMTMFPSDWFKAAAAIPNIMLALSYQMNLFPIFKGMKNVTDKKYKLASMLGISFCVFSYLLIGLLGYDYGGAGIEANFLRNLLYSKIPPVLFFMINFFFLASIFFAFPILFFGCRNNFIALIKLVLLKDSELKNGRRGDDVEEISSYIRTAVKVEDRRKKARLHFIAYTMGIYMVIIAVSIGVESIESVFNVIGAVCSTSISILLPGFFYVSLTRSRKQPKTFKYYFAIALSCVMGPYAIFSMLALYI